MPEDVAEIVAHVRAPRAGREGSLDVADLAPHLVPDLRQPVCPELRLDLHLHHRQTGRGPRLDEIDLRKLLHRHLDPVCDLELHLLRARPGVGRGDDRGLDGEEGILELAEREKAGDTGKRQQSCGEIRDRALFNSDLSKTHDGYVATG